MNKIENEFFTCKKCNTQLHTLEGLKIFEKDGKVYRKVLWQCYTCKIQHRELWELKEIVSISSEGGEIPRTLDH